VQIPRVPIDGAPSPRFGLSLLGGFELTGPDGVVDLPSKKLAGLLAYLACTAPRPQSREKLSALLWGSHFDAQAKQNLRQALSRLRKVLGEDALESDGEVVSLNAAAVLCDVSRFEILVREGSRDALSAAADLYRGRLIDDVTVSEEGWNEWLAGERERDLALGAMMKLGEQELAAGRAGHALKAGQRAIALNNMREDAHRLIVQALAATGRKAEALKHYQDLVALLKHELNTEPDAATRSLAAELRATEPPSRSPPVKIAGPALPQPDRPSIVALPAVDMRRDHKEQSTENPAVDGDAAVPAVALRSGSPERRQLTIMVCNIVGSVPLSARLDPEDMHDLIAVFHKVVADAVSRFDGFVAQYLGDGAHVYFGYPAAHEHDAEQAVRAGFAVLDAVGALKASFDVTLQASVGIATGLVVVGERPVTGDTQQRVAIGEAPSVAAQLQALASPGEVVIAASTWRLVGRMFDCRALEMDKSLQAVEAWQVRCETAGVSRFEARRTGALSPLMGRQEEMELLLRRWNQARLGEGRVVLLSGEPGIGKSRIAESLLAAREGEPHARLRYFCSPHHTHSPLYPFIVQIERAAGFEPGSSAGAKLDKLEALLKPAAKNVPQDLALIADLLLVPADERYPALAVSPAQKREITLTAILDQLDGIAARSPVLIVFEDAHWIDPTSLDLLDRTVARVANLPVLLVVTGRPEFQPTWVGQPHVTMLTLSRLGRRDSAGIIGSITKDKALPNAVVEQILAHTDGVPLFIEELTSSLLESGLLRETTDSYMLDGPLPPLAIPTSLQASLVARLDRLASVKDVAQIGAAIGREFSHELISAVSASTPADLDAALERLMASGLVSRRGMPPEATYSFKHALVQDAAYGTLLKSRRRQLHARIAKALVERFPAIADSQPEVIAHHFTEAGLASEAIGYWRRAGQIAATRSANREAVTFFERAVHLLKLLPQTRTRLEQAIDLRFDLRAALFQLGEFERIIGYLREAEGMARTLGDQRRLGQLSVFLCHNRRMAGQLNEAIGFGRNAQAIAESLKDVPLQVTANLDLGAACLGTGDCRQAEVLFRKILGWLDGDRRRERFGQTIFPAVAAHGYLTWIFADWGRFEEAIAHGREALQLAEALDHAYSRAFALWALARPYIVRGDFSDAAALLERGTALSREWNLTFLSVLNIGGLGYACAFSGRMAEGISLLRQALSANEAVPGGAMMLPLCLIYLGEADILAGRPEDALAIVERAATVSRECGQRGYEARALRLLGDIAALRDRPKEAESHYGDTIALAGTLGFRPLVAHCHLGLSKVHLRTGKRDQARDHLTAATTMYRDMGMTYWLEQAELHHSQ
jgi:DNA-binding SARP family transcriptional activator/class 3 adenylate cyclase